jgi:TPR repeat protein
MTFFDAMRILELAAPITPEGVDRAAHAVMHRLEDLVRRSPADADLAARAYAYAGEVRAAHAFLLERPEHLHPHRMVAPPVEKQMPPAPDARMPPMAVQAPTMESAALPALETGTQALSTPPLSPQCPASIASCPAESSRPFSAWLGGMVWAVLIIACGFSVWYGAEYFSPSSRPTTVEGSSLSSNQPVASSGTSATKPVSTSAAAALRGVFAGGNLPENAYEGGSSRRLVVTTAPDGTVVANMPDGSTLRQKPGGNRYGTYGPNGSPFGNGSTRRPLTAGTSQFHEATEQGDAEAIYLRAKMLLFPPSPPSSAPEGLRLLEKAASQNHLMASYMLACTYLDGIGRPADIKKGVSMLRSLTNGRNFPVASLRLADCHRDGLGVAYDYQYALSVYRHWETLPAAQYRISLMYQHGCGVDKDDAEAVKWLQIAVAASYSPAFYQMGLRYAKGLGVPQDDLKAAQAYEMAAKLGYAPAQAALGRCYLNSRGVPFESGLVIHYFQQAAIQDFPHAQDYLGSAYAKGECIWTDPKQATGWYAKAAAQGHGPAQMHLGRFLLEDHPELPADPVRALAWFIRAESENVEGAAEMVRDTRKQLSPKAIAAAELAATNLPHTSAWNQWQPLSP